jgi:hypothetical protein
LPQRSTLVIPHPGVSIDFSAPELRQQSGASLFAAPILCACIQERQIAAVAYQKCKLFYFFCDEETAPGPSASPRTAGAMRLAGRDLKISGDPRRGRRATTIRGLIGPRRVPRQEERVAPVAELKLWRCRRRTRARKIVKLPCWLRRRRREAD